MSFCWSNFNMVETPTEVSHQRIITNDFDLNKAEITYFKHQIHCKVVGFFLGEEEK